MPCSGLTAAAVELEMHVVSVHDSVLAEGVILDSGCLFKRQSLWNLDFC